MAEHGQSCRGCAYFVPDPIVEARADTLADGECHHGPPHAAHGWPAVRSVDWCGRWRSPMGAYDDRPPQRPVPVVGEQVLRPRTCPVHGLTCTGCPARPLWPGEPGYVAPTPT